MEQEYSEQGSCQWKRLVPKGRLSHLILSSAGPSGCTRSEESRKQLQFAFSVGIEFFRHKFPIFHLVSLAGGWYCWENKS